jgi:four helix bundle protein
MNGHRKLHIWQAAGDLISAVYEITSGLPADEKFVSVPQLRRAAWSVQNNVAEGNARMGRGDRRRFFNTALSSLDEVDSMVAKLGDLYALNEAATSAVERARSQITAGLISLTKERGR